jgi:EmrB/QacA subfamily drug resistance transporter
MIRILEDDMYSKPHSANLTICAVALGTFMCSFNINAVNMALPLIQSDFARPTAVVEWVVIAYLLALSSTLLGFGRLADMVGHKRVYVAGFALFTVCAALCAFSPSIATLIVAVVMQGLSAAMMLSSSNAIIVGAVPASSRGKALGATSIAVALATCAGPSLGGLLATSFGWKAVYLAGLPIGAVGTAMSAFLIREVPTKPDARFDALGFGLIVLFLSSTLVPLDLLSSSMSATPLVIGLLVVAVAALAAFLVAERRSAHPILDLGLFRNRAFVAGNVAATLFYVSMFAVVFAAPFFLQKLEGLTPTSAGLAMLPMSLALMATAPIAGALSDRIDSRAIGCVGMVVVAASELAFLSGIVQGSALGRIAAFALMGIGMGLFTTPNTSVVMGAAPADRRGVAGATLATMRNVGMVFGEAIAAMLLSSIMAGRGVGLGDSAADPAWRAAFRAGMDATCAVAAIAAIAAAVLIMLRSAAPSAESAAAVKPAAERR